MAVAVIGGCSSMASPARQTLDGRAPLVIAHRGASGYLPENTLEAYRNAYAVGAESIEGDVHMTRDGVIVVSHDDTVDRCVLKFSLNVTFDMLPGLMAEINRINAMLAASSVRVESKYPSSDDDAPGKS